MAIRYVQADFGCGSGLGRHRIAPATSTARYDLSSSLATREIEEPLEADVPEAPSLRQMSDSLEDCWSAALGTVGDNALALRRGASSQRFIPPADCRRKDLTAWGHATIGWCSSR